MLLLLRHRRQAIHIFVSFIPLRQRRRLQRITCFRQSYLRCWTLKWNRNRNKTKQRHQILSQFSQIIIRVFLLLACHFISFSSLPWFSKKKKLWETKYLRYCNVYRIEVTYLKTHEIFSRRTLCVCACVYDVYIYNLHAVVRCVMCVTCVALAHKRLFVCGAHAMHTQRAKM